MAVTAEGPGAMGPFGSWHRRRHRRWEHLLALLPPWFVWPVLVLDTLIFMAFPLLGGLLFFLVEGELRRRFPGRPYLEGWPRTLTFWAVIASSIGLEAWIGNRIDEWSARRRVAKVSGS
jgi:hypothetical protein